MQPTSKVRNNTTRQSITVDELDHLRRYVTYKIDPRVEIKKKKNGEIQGNICHTNHTNSHNETFK